MALLSLTDQTPIKGQPSSTVSGTGCEADGSGVRMAYLGRVVRQLVADGREPEVVFGSRFFVRPACAMRRGVHQRVGVACV